MNLRKDHQQIHPYQPTVWNPRVCEIKLFKKLDVTPWTLYQRDVGKRRFLIGIRPTFLWTNPFFYNPIVTTSFQLTISLLTQRWLLAKRFKTLLADVTYCKTHDNLWRWISWLVHRWRTQQNAIRSVNCRIQWIIESLNANCASGYSREHVCLSGSKTYARQRMAPFKRVVFPLADLRFSWIWTTSLFFKQSTCLEIRFDALTSTRQKTVLKRFQ